MNSFQQKMKVKMAALPMAGMESGVMMRSISPITVSPSSTAASIRVVGSERMYATAGIRRTGC